CSDESPTSSESPNTVSQEIGPDGGKITSEDGDLTLTFPEGALSQTETITVETLDPDNPPEPFEEIEDITAAYELRPDGLTFNEPVTATFNIGNELIIDGDSIKIPVSVLATQGNEQNRSVLVNNLRKDLDPETGLTRMRGDMSHFSSLIARETLGVLLTVTGIPENLPTGETFAPEVVVNATGSNYIESFDNVKYYDYSLEPVIAVKPNEIPRDLTGDGEIFSDKIQYKCDEPGTGRYLPLVYLEDVEIANGEDVNDGHWGSVALTITSAGSSRGDEFFFDNLSEEFAPPVECTEPTAASFNSFDIAESAGLEATVDWNFQLNNDVNPDNIDLELHWDDETISTPSIGDKVDDNPPTYWGQEDHTYDIPGEYVPRGVLIYDGEPVDESQTEFVTPAAPSIVDGSAEWTDLRTVNFNLQMSWEGDLEILKATFDGNSDGENVMDVPLEKDDSESEFMGEFEYEYSENLDFPIYSLFKITNTKSGKSNSKNIEVQEFNLTVDKEGVGNVTGFASFLGAEVINCGSDCEEKFLFSPNFTGLFDFAGLTATPNDGYEFTGWEGDTNDGIDETTCEGTGDCEIVMNQNRTITATFEKTETGEEADIEVNITEYPESLEPGETDSITIKYTNNGNNTTDGFGTRIEASNGTIYGVAENEDFNCDDTPANEIGCNCPGELEAGEMKELSIEVEAEDTGTMTVEATGSAANANEDSDTVEVPVEEN
ncbi:MAG: hypothetical protein R3220_05210, partial [Balneolaceae bacterium]|nr:hypothetical protein [Balneolaceae bacterium]